MNKCIGCGITLQNKDKNFKGYTPNLDNKYCERCFKTIHYNQNIITKNIDNQNIITKINKLNYFTFFISDLFNLNNEVVDNFKKIKNQKILILNKCDLIPNNLKLENLEENIRKVYDLKEEILFISASQKLYLNYLKNIINSYKKVIFCGETSSGKSTLINNLFNTVLTTSKYQNTTLDFIKINKDNILIFDSPGLLLNRTNYIEKIKCYTKKINNNYILTINDLKLNGNANLTIFVDNKIKINSKKETINLEYEIKIDKPIRN